MSETEYPKGMPDGTVPVSPESTTYAVRGSLDGADATIVLRDGEVLMDPAVRERAQLIVALDDPIVDPDGNLIGVASLDETPLVALVTAMRALDRIHSIEMSMSHRDGPPKRAR